MQVLGCSVLLYASSLRLSCLILSYLAGANFCGQEIRLVVCAFIRPEVRELSWAGACCFCWLLNSCSMPWLDGMDCSCCMHVVFSRALPAHLLLLVCAACKLHQAVHRSIPTCPPPLSSPCCAGQL